jgi:hypothetical protein
MPIVDRTFMLSLSHVTRGLRGKRSLAIAGLIALAIPAAAQAAVPSNTSSSAKKVQFRAVVASVLGDTVRLTLHSGQHLTVTPKRSPVINAGDTVLVTEKTLAHHATSVTISVLKKAPAVGPIVPTTASGALVAIGTRSLTFLLSNGSTLTAAMPADAITYLTNNRKLPLCETATIAYHATPSGAVLDLLTPTGITTSPAVSLGSFGNCTTHSDGEVDVVGTIAAISPLTVTLSLPGGGQFTVALAAGRDLATGEAVGNVVDVTFDPTSHIAYDLEDSELYTTGAVTALNSTTSVMTIRDTVSGNLETFPPSEANVFKVNVGDRVGVVYWVNHGTTRSDNVSDLTNGAVN